MTSKKLKVETWPIDKLIPYARNPRKNDQAVEQVAAAIKEFGFRVPIVAKSDGLLVDGHLRLKAAQKLGLKEVPVVLADDLSDAQIKAFRISVNRMAELAEWDNELLALEFAELKDLGFDTSLTGFDDAMVSEIMPNKSEPLTDEDAVPEVDEQAPPKTKIGDVWILGNHRVMCGDSTDEAMVAKLMNGVKADMVFTDPPYGVDYSGGIQFTKEGVTKNTREKLVNDHDASIYSKVIPIICKFADGPCYTWYAASKATPLYQAIDEYGEFHAMIVWHKTNAKYATLNAQYKNRHEPCAYWKPKKSTLRWCGASTEATVWEEKRDPKNIYHPTQKPTCLAERAINNHEAKTVLDLFLGSGSTLIACEKTGRKCYGMELSPQYISIIIQRWQEYTGKEAHLEETGETFNSIASR
jgi:hypothetical protein